VNVTRGKAGKQPVHAEKRLGIGAAKSQSVI